MYRVFLRSCIVLIAVISSSFAHHARCDHFDVTLTSLDETTQSENELISDFQSGKLFALAFDLKTQTGLPKRRSLYNEVRTTLYQGDPLSIAPVFSLVNVKGGDGHVHCEFQLQKSSTTKRDVKRTVVLFFGRGDDITSAVPFITISPNGQFQHQMRVAVPKPTQTNACYWICVREQGRCRLLGRLRRGRIEHVLVGNPSESTQEFGKQEGAQEASAQRATANSTELVATTKSPIRSWNSLDGSRVATARAIGMIDGMVFFECESGSLCKCSLLALSPDDQAYLESLPLQIASANSISAIAP